MKNVFLTLILVLFLLSCNKKAPEFPAENNCEKYAGLYDMYDPENNVHYNMIIECVAKSDHQLADLDSIYYKNYGNKWNLANMVIEIFIYDLKGRIIDQFAGLGVD